MIDWCIPPQDNPAQVPLSRSFENLSTDDSTAWTKKNKIKNLDRNFKWKNKKVKIDLNESRDFLLNFRKSLKIF